MAIAKPFTSMQQSYIAAGERHAAFFKDKIEHALGVARLEVSPKRHHYIVGGPGIGKTYTVNEVAKKHKVELTRIQGVASMSAVGILLATAAYMNQDRHMYVWIDDCDSVFGDANSLSVMKGVFDEDRNVLAWNKNMIAAIAQYEKSDNASTQLVATALRHFQPENGAGIEIPTDNMTFIVTSNRTLTAPNPPPKTTRKIDESAIRDRVVYTEYTLTRDETWGWMAATTLKAKLPKVDKADKHLLLDWMYNNWERLPSVSMRAITELAADMVNYPDSYPDHWHSRLVRAS